ITALKNELRKLKRKNVVNIAISKPNATIDPGMFKLDIEALYPRLKNNRDAHEVYIEKTIEYTGTLRGFVESARTQNPSKPLLESSCMFTKHLQKLLVCVSQTCPSSPTPSGKVVAITPINKDKRVRLLNLSKPTTSASGSKPSGNTKNNRSRDHHIAIRRINNALVKHSVRNAKFGSMCAICNKCLFDANHDMCLIDHVNVRSKSKSKRNKKRKAWKPTGKVFTDIGYKWKPTGRLFTIVGSSCPLTRITPKKIVHLKKTTSKLVKTPKQKIKVYSRRPKLLKLVGSSKKAKIVESKTANNSESTHLWGSNATYVPSSSSLVNDMSSRSSSGIWTMDENVIIYMVYYVEGLRHNLFSVGQFCDADLEVAFKKNTCFIRNLEGVDLLSGSRNTNLYTISFDDMLKTSPICLLSKASKTKSWLWHRHLSYLNFGTLNKLAKDGLARGISKLKFQKDHLCSACALGKSKKSSHKPKTEDTNQEKLYLLHMDLCGPMCVESNNGKKYILVIVDDYSRFTWVKFLRSKDEAPDTIIKCIKNIQVRLNATVRNVRIDNGTEFVNQTLRDFYENVSISHQNSVAHTPQQNDVVKRRNRTLVEAARTMLIFSKAPLFLWAEAINTACYTQNRSLIRLRYNKTPYELMHDKKPDLSFFHVFGSLCYPTNNSEDLGKLNAKADIGLGLQVLTPATSSSGLVQNIIPQQPCNPPKRDDWDTLFQPLFDEYFNPLTIAVSTVPVAAAPRAVKIDDSPVSTSIGKDAPSLSIPST
ncbi:retrovirus-related pol polyprotein from transposon TNT 1-94, partial [Tanacetum coccineum]